MARNCTATVWGVGKEQDRQQKKLLQQFCVCLMLLQRHCNISRAKLSWLCNCDVCCLFALLHAEIKGLVTAYCVADFMKNSTTPSWWKMAENKNGIHFSQLLILQTVSTEMQPDAAPFLSFFNCSRNSFSLSIDLCTWFVPLHSLCLEHLLPFSFQLIIWS